jgi:hypothetical protein
VFERVWRGEEKLKERMRLKYNRRMNENRLNLLRNEF